jgi:DNA-binding NarL/FixJ family response regulator
MERRVRILIADDQLPTRDGLKSLLALDSQLLIVGEASNGKDAVRMAAECHPDVILMDVQMPVMDGLEATRCIKSQWPRIRVVALTMYAAYEGRALDAGADAFVLKGGPANTLQAAILGC